VIARLWRTAGIVGFTVPFIILGSFLLAERVGDVRKIVRGCQWQLYGV
jgi:hypothetical protein